MQRRDLRSGSEKADMPMCTNPRMRKIREMTLVGCGSERGIISE